MVLELLTLTPTVKSVKDLPDEEAELKFVKIFRELMRLRNILESFSEFDDEDLTLPAQRFDPYTHKIHRRQSRRQVIGDSDKDRRATVIYRKQRHNA